MQLLSVNVAMPSVLYESEEVVVVSGIDKHPVDSPRVRLSSVNLEGDGQADTRPTSAGGQVHGGPDQAVYAFPSEHFARIAAITGRDVGAGFMGENLTLVGATERDVCIGDVWQWGDARLQVTAPRGPCYKIGIRMGRQSARRIIREEGLVGWYLRVLRPAVVPTAGPIEVVERHVAGVSVANIQRALLERDVVDPQLVALDALSRTLRASLLRRGRDLTGGVPEAD